MQDVLQELLQIKIALQQREARQDGICERVECGGHERNGERQAKNHLDGLIDATRADKEQMNQIASTNEAVVELY